MRLLLSPGAADRIVRRWYWYVLGGVALVVLAVGWLRDVGFVSGLMLFLFGLGAFGFQSWLRERGLWMLAALALTAYVPLYLLMQYDAWKRHLNGPPGRPVWLAVDTAVALLIVWQAVRFFATVLWVNRELSRPVRARRPSGTPDA